MAQAVWNNGVLAEAPIERCEQVEGNIYFPPDAIKREYFVESTQHTVCPWKGTASYFDVVVNGQRNKDAAWYYPEPKSAANNIKNYVAFWKGVKVTEE
jgi:uncharacterized protein (DUF427 family)